MHACMLSLLYPVLFLAFICLFRWSVSAVSFSRSSLPFFIYSDCLFLHSVSLYIVLPCFFHLPACLSCLSPFCFSMFVSSILFALCLPLLVSSLPVFSLSVCLLVLCLSLSFVYLFYLLFVCLSLLLAAVCKGDTSFPTSRASNFSFPLLLPSFLHACMHKCMHACMHA